jgi:HEPN pEK499 p136
MANAHFPKRDFIERTMSNLAFIEAAEKVDGKGPYEFTQLVNSFLMAFIHAKSNWLDSFPEMPFPAKDWPEIKWLNVGHPKSEPKNARELVKKIRNALAHGNFTILSDGKNEICAVELWNTPTEEIPTIIWQSAEISVDDLHKILEAFASQIVEIAKNSGK